MVKLLNVKAMEKMVAGENHYKICNGIKENRFDMEAINYLLNEAVKIDSFITNYNFVSVMKTLTGEGVQYKMSDFYKGFEDYIYSPLAKALLDLKSTGDYIGWFDFFPEEDEIQGLYEMASFEVKRIIYKTLVYRRTSFGINPKFADTYANSYRTLIQMIVEHEDMTELKACDYFFKWSYAVNQKAIEGIETMIGQEATIEAVNRRTHCRYSQSATEMSLRDFYACANYSFSRNAMDGEWIMKDLIRYFDVFNWLPNSLNKASAELMKEIYNKYMAPMLFEGNGSVMIFRKGETQHLFRNNIGLMLSLEDRDDRKTAMCDIYRKLNNGTALARAVSNAVYMADARKLALSINIPEQVSKDSLKFAYRIDEFLPSHKINAEELKEIHNTYFPHLKTISSFGENKLLSKYIDIEQMLLDDADIKLDFDSDFCDYFPDQIIPLSIIRKYYDEIGHYTCLRSLRMNRNITLEDVLALEKDYHMFANKDSDENNVVFSRALANAGSKDAKLVAEAIVALKLDEVDRLYNANNTELDKMSLRNILTLL